MSYSVVLEAAAIAAASAVAAAALTGWVTYRVTNRSVSAAAEEAERDRQSSLDRLERQLEDAAIRDAYLTITRYARSCSVYISSGGREPPPDDLAPVDLFCSTAAVEAWRELGSAMAEVLEYASRTAAPSEVLARAQAAANDVLTISRRDLRVDK